MANIAHFPSFSAEETQPRPFNGSLQRHGSKKGVWHRCAQLPFGPFRQRRLTFLTLVFVPSIKNGSSGNRAFRYEGRDCRDSSSSPQRGGSSEPRATPWVAAPSIFQPERLGRCHSQKDACASKSQPFRLEGLCNPRTQGVALGLDLSVPWTERPSRWKALAGRLCHGHSHLPRFRGRSLPFSKRASPGRALKMICVA
jgi:hypothetical protein